MSARGPRTVDPNAGTSVTFSVRLDAAAGRALRDLCGRWRCSRADAVRRALVEAADGADVVARLERIETLLRAGEGRPSAPAPVVPTRAAPADPDPAVAATIRGLGAWGTEG